MRAIAMIWKLPLIRFGGAGLLFSGLFLSAPAQAPKREDTCRAVSIPYTEAQLIVKALENSAPLELRGKNPEALAQSWETWVASHDVAVRGRMNRGDEDLLGNILLFGTSFTPQPRITIKDLAPMSKPPAGSPSGAAPDIGSFAGKVMDARLNDFIRAVETPGTNDRLAYLNRLIRKKGYGYSGAGDRAKLRQYLLANLLRVLGEQTGFAKTREEARGLGDSTAEFAARSTLYRTRGLSVDTALFSSYAIEEALKGAKARGLLTGVNRAAVIGPGLDFADKQGGYDFYPEQTIQPFALIDSLARLGLSRAEKVEVTTIDINPQVNDHLAAARQRAQRGVPYISQLPRDLDSAWKPGTLSYWEQFGSHIGSAAKTSAVPLGIKRLRMRAVSIRPDVVLRVTPCGMNIVLQRLDMPEAGNFDLIVATNILIYYDVFEQSLALANIAHMLKPGGLLLSNNALMEFPGSPLHSVDYLTVVYSDDRPDDGDHIVWYQRRP
jgi:hypothetical protein